MDNEIKSLIEKMDLDLDMYAKKRDIDKMYIIQIAIKWTRDHGENKEDLCRKIKLIEELLENIHFINAIIMNKKIHNNSEDINIDECAQESATLVKLIRSSEVHEEVMKETGFSILEKFEFIETHKDRDLGEYKEKILEWVKYIKEKVKELENLKKETNNGRGEDGGRS